MERFNHYTGEFALKLNKMAIPEFEFNQDERADNAYLDAGKAGEGKGTVDFVQDTDERVATNPPPQDQISTPETLPVGEREPIPFNESEYLGGLFNIPAPKPAYDEGREKRLETMAAARGVGKALATLGDAFALSQGAIVPKRQVAQTDPAVSQILEDQKRFREKMDEAEFRDYLNKLRTGQAISKAKRSEYEFDVKKQAAEEGRKLEREKFGYQQERDVAAREAAERKLGIETGLKERGLDISQQRADETERHNRAMELAALARANKGTSKDKKYGIYNVAGNKVADIDEGQIDKAFDIIKNNVDIGSDLQLLKAQLGEGLTREHKKTIVSAYWDQVPEVQDFLQVERTGQQPAPTGQEKEEKTFKFPGLGN